MRYFKKITVFENKKRITTLKLFKEYVKQYFNNIKHIMYGSEISENETAKEYRSKINLILNQVHAYIIFSGVKTTIYYSPPVTTGGIAGQVDLLHNIFNFHNLQLDSKQLMDSIERSIGIYENDRVQSIIRTFNPFFWIDFVFTYFSRIPFKIIGSIGFNQNKLESSILGKIIKMILYLIMVFSAFLTVLDKLNLLDSFRSIF